MYIFILYYYYYMLLYQRHHYNYSNIILSYYTKCYNNIHPKMYVCYCIYCYIYYTGVIPLLLKAIRKNMDSEDLATVVFNVFYYISCDERLRVKLSGAEVMELLG